MATYNITDADLKKSAQTYEKEILVMPVIAASETLQHMSGIPGLAGRHTLAQFDGDIELGPYDPNRVDTDGVAIKPRTLETFLGSTIKRFDVNEVAKTVYGSLATQGQPLTQANIARQTLNYLAALLGKKLNTAIWKGVRNDGDTTTNDLFDGFDTITSKEITAGTIAAGKGNYKKLEALTPQNAFDLLNDFYLSADDNLQAQNTKLYVPRTVYNLYNQGALAELGAVSYNQAYDKHYLTVSGGRCELVPLTSKAGSKFLHLSTANNLVYGYGDGLADEKIAIEKYHEFLLSFVATMFFGVQFRTVSPEMLRVAELTL